MEASVQELKERVEQLEAEIAFRKQNGLDCAELTAEFAEVCARVVHGPGPDIDEEDPEAEDVWDFVERMQPVTKGILLRHLSGFTAQVEQVYADKDHVGLHELLDAPFMKVYLLGASFYADENEPAGPAVPPLHDRNPVSVEEAAEWAEDAYLDFVSCLHKEMEALWSGRYPDGAAAGMRAYTCSCALSAYMERAEYVETET